MTVAELAAAIAADIRKRGHLQDVDDPKQAGRAFIVGPAYRSAPKQTRRAFIAVMNDRHRMEKRADFQDSETAFGPLAAVIAWSNRKKTKVVLAALDEIADDSQQGAAKTRAKEA